MNITIIIGWVVSFSLVTFGIFNGGQLDWFIDVPSLAITVGGTIGCLFASFPLSYLKNLPKYLKLALFPKKFNPQSYIELNLQRSPEQKVLSRLKTVRTSVRIRSSRKALC